MKVADIKIGETYYTKVSEALVKVVVTNRVEPDGGWSKQTRFRVKRVDNDKVLPNTRAASALRPLLAGQSLIDAAKAVNVLERDGKWLEALDAWNALAKDAAEAKRPKMSAYALLRAKIAHDEAFPSAETAK